MKTIYKYKLENTDLQTIEMPKFAKILCVQIQNGEPHIWAEVESTNPITKKSIAIIGTGHPRPFNPMTYIGSYQLYDGQLVFHVYELI